MEGIDKEEQQQVVDTWQSTIETITKELPRKWCKVDGKCSDRFPWITDELEELMQRTEQQRLRAKKSGSSEKER